LIYQSFDKRHLAKPLIKTTHIAACTRGPNLADTEKEIVKAALRGFNRAIILWLISKKPMSGYSVVKEMNKLTGEKFKQGTIYPLLYELEKNGALSGQWTQKGSMRIKKYAITQDGLKQLSYLREVFQMPLKEAMTDLMGQNTPDKHVGSDTMHI
jgi:DNA-binding PadR family transcriptional regulator